MQDKAPAKRRMKPSPKASIDKYGVKFPGDTSDLDMEIFCIRRGGRWTHKHLGHECGLGIHYHYKQMDRLLWPEDVWDEWDEKIDAFLLDGGVRGLAGPSSAGKSSRLAKVALRMYWVWPRGFTCLISTTTLKDLENRVWGEVKMLYARARARYPLLPGHLRESAQSITTENLDSDEGSDFRNGIKGVACKIGNKFVGLGPYSGIKNARVALLADEGHLMPSGYFDIVGNLSSNPWYLVAASGNPNDPTNSFGQVCEPKIGWDLLQQGDGDQEWESRAGRVLRLDGLAAPNLRLGPGNEPCTRKLTHRYIEGVRNTYGEGSWQWEMWVRARFVLSVMEKRLFVRKFAERYHAFDEPQWSDQPLVSLLAIDAAYGAVGGDRCIAIHFKYGLCTDGKTRLAIKEGPMLVPVTMGGDMLPERQIVAWTADYCSRHDIHPSHVGFDSTGRGSLMSEFAKHFSPDVVAIEFGGAASDRPDPQHPGKLAKDSYLYMVTELAFALRACIEADQFRAITLDIVLEAEQRAWETRGMPTKVKLETKDETRDRIKKSPDLLDSCIVGVELARRLGFVIRGDRPHLMRGDTMRHAREAAQSWAKANSEKALNYA